MTIGDVLAVIALLLATAATWAATILLVAMAFPARAAEAQRRIIASPGACLARGVGVFFVLGLLAVVFFQSPGPARLISGVLAACLGALAAVGSAGIARLIGERIGATGSHMAPFASLTRGTILYVLAGYLPVIGWFFVAPVALLLSLGGAVAALRSRRAPAPVIASAPAPAELRSEAV